MTEHRLEVADVFRQHEQEFLKRWGHSVSTQQLRAFRDICACRTAALGAQVEQCDGCSHQIIAYDSCRNRHCPKCQTTARDKWLAARTAELLPVPYCHMVFTLPQELSTIALQNPRLIYSLLFRAVSETLLTIATDPRHLGAHIGFLAVLHTWNQKMLPHPHLHCLIPAGGLSLNRSRWVRCRRRFCLPVRVLRKMFRGKFLAFLAAAFRNKKLRLSGTTPHLAAVGVYGVMSYLVAQSTHDIGVRMALGARAGDILGLVVRRGMTLGGIGIAGGLIGAALVTRVMSSMLFGVSEHDAVTFSVVAVILAAVAFAATVIPAARATRVDPMVALRQE